MDGNQAINRIPPAGSARDYVTYAIASPFETHYRPATCEEVDCEAHASGWVTRLDLTTDLGQQQGRYIQDQSNRRYKAVKTGEIVEITFFPGQQCFAQHRVALDRPAVFLLRGGDHRGNPTGERPVMLDPDQWVDDFANHQLKLVDQIEKG